MHSIIIYLNNIILVCVINLKFEKNYCINVLMTKNKIELNVNYYYNLYNIDNKCALMKIVEQDQYIIMKTN